MKTLTGIVAISFMAGILSVHTSVQADDGRNQENMCHMVVAAQMKAGPCREFVNQVCNVAGGRMPPPGYVVGSNYDFFAACSATLPENGMQTQDGKNQEGMCHTVVAAQMEAGPCREFVNQVCNAAGGRMPPPGYVVGSNYDFFPACSAKLPGTQWSD